MWHQEDSAPFNSASSKKPSWSPQARLRPTALRCSPLTQGCRLTSREGAVAGSSVFESWLRLPGPLTLHLKWAWHRLSQLSEESLR